MSHNRKFRRMMLVAAAMVAGSPTVALAMPMDYSPAAGAQPATSAASSASVDLRSPDARDAASGVTASVAGDDLRSPDTRDFAAGIDVGGVSVPQPAVHVVAVHHNDFSWGDAGIGAGGAITLMLLITGGVVLATHRRQRSTGPSPLAG